MARVQVASFDLTQRERTEVKLGGFGGQGIILAGLILGRAATVYAGRNAVLPEDIQAVLPSVVSHRLERRDAAMGSTGAGIAAELILAVPVPL